MASIRKMKRSLQYTLISLSFFVLLLSSFFVNSFLRTSPEKAYKQVSAATATLPTTPFGQPGAWQLAFNDEFDTRHYDASHPVDDPYNVSGLDENKWVDCYPEADSLTSGCHDYGLGAARPENISVNENNDGLLRLKVRQQPVTINQGGQTKTYQYTSGIVTSGRIINDPRTPSPKFEYTYGYAEARIKIPKGVGLWPSFWSLRQYGTGEPTPYPEIDTVEILARNTNEQHMTYHFPGDPTQNQNGTTYKGPDASGDFHVLASDWGPGEIYWYLDGKFAKCFQDSTISNKDSRCQTSAYPVVTTKSLYMILSMGPSNNPWACEGFTTCPDTSTWIQPTDYLIDWVRVWKRTGGSRFDNYNPYEEIEAENFSGKSGTELKLVDATASPNPTDNGFAVGYIRNSYYTNYNNLNFGAGPQTFTARVSSGAAGGNIEVRLDSPTGTLAGICPVQGTGDWYGWTSVTCGVNGISGTHNLYLVYTGGTNYLFNLNSFKFTGSTQPSPTPTTIVSTPTVSTVSPTGCALPKATNLAPVGTVTAGQTTFQWSAVPGAQYYQMRVDDLANAFDYNCVNNNPGDVCDNNVPLTVCSNGSCRYPVQNITQNYPYSTQAGHTYTWRVIALASGCTYSMTDAQTIIAVAPSIAPTLTPTPQPIDTTPPTVTITSPSAGTVRRGSTINFTANASDNIAVQKVEFYVNSSIKSTDLVLPYTYSWSVPSKPGVMYILKAIAYDTSGNTSSSTVVVTSQ